MVNKDIDTDNLGTLDELAVAEAKEQARKVAKPLIDHLEDAVGQDQFGNPVLNAGVGDKIIIERVASILSHRPWLDTKTYVIQSVDGVTGDLLLLDTDIGQQAGSNFITGPQRGYRFKLPNAKGLSIGKRRRGRPRKNPTEAPTSNKPAQPAVGTAPKKRGRPAGSKNRPKEVIRAEKKARLEKRKAKRKPTKTPTRTKRGGK